MKKVIAVAFGLMLLPYLGFAVLLYFLWMFWENLGNLTLSVYDDYWLSKTEKARKWGRSANLERFYAHILTIWSIAFRRQHRDLWHFLASKRSLL